MTLWRARLLFCLAVAVLAERASASVQTSSVPHAGDGRPTAAAAQPASPVSATEWQCVQLPLPSGAPASGGLRLERVNCTSKSFLRPVGPIPINILAVNLSAYRLEPAVAHASAPGAVALQTLPAMGAQDARFVAGINGGYFYRLDVASFKDDVCRGKTRSEAQQAAAAGQPNAGLSDSQVLVAGNRTLGSNCDCHGYSRPAVLTLLSPQDGRGRWGGEAAAQSAEIVVLERGQQWQPPPAAAASASCLAAGPNLVSNGSIDILPDDDNINILESAANAGVGLRAGEALLVTVDGLDGNPLSPTLGMNAHHLAAFFRDHLQVDSAMGMDQGGSTTMWVRSVAACSGVVSHANRPQGQCDSPRSVFSGLFVRAA